MQYLDKPHPLKTVSLSWLANRNAAALSSDNHHVHRATVEKYKKLTTPAPPILVDESGRIIDGLHRTKTALEKGQTEISAHIQPQPA